jgi:hypothetical protein
MLVSSAMTARAWASSIKKAHFVRLVCWIERYGDQPGSSQGEKYDKEFKTVGHHNRHAVTGFQSGTPQLCG